jgi:hypothetical protein
VCRILLWRLGFSALRLLTRCVCHHLLDGTDVVRPLLLESFEIQLLNVLRQGNLPGFLPVIGHASELLGIDPELSRHLDMGMGKVEPLSGIDPCLEFGRQVSLIGHNGTLYTSSGLLRFLPAPAGQLFESGDGVSLAQIAKSCKPCHL